MSLTTSRHTYSSRGRTRQPKNLALPFHEGTAVQPIPQAHFKASGSVTVVTASGDLSETLAGTAAGTNGYDTQNQSHLHLCISGGSSAGSFAVYAYNRQFGTWGILKAPVKLDSANTEGAYVPVEFTGSNDITEYVVLPIHGIDRVAFVGSSINDTVLYAAGSTI